MGFPSKIAEQALLDCGRHCCVCHKFCGSKIELHHIEQRADDGEDSYDNCIPVCFDCHADVKSYNDRHPKGRKYSSSELKGHRDKWYEKVRNSPALQTDAPYRDLDRRLFANILEELRGSIMDCVCKHDYGNAFQGDWHKGLHDFLSCSESPESEFFDADLEGARAQLRAGVRQFLILLGQHTFPGKRLDDGGKWYRMNGDPVDNPYLLADLHKRAEDETQLQRFLEEHRAQNAEIREQLNAEAQRLCDTYQQFVRFGRRKLVV